jgi:hypothetical protein
MSFPTAQFVSNRITSRRPQCMRTFHALHPLTQCTLIVYDADDGWRAAAYISAFAPHAVCMSFQDMRTRMHCTSALQTTPADNPFADAFVVVLDGGLSAPFNDSLMAHARSVVFFNSTLDMLPTFHMFLPRTPTTVMLGMVVLTGCTLCAYLRHAMPEHLPLHALTLPSAVVPPPLSARMQACIASFDALRVT